jgi:Phage integrase family
VTASDGQLREALVRPAGAFCGQEPGVDGCPLVSAGFSFDSTTWEPRHSLAFGPGGGRTRRGCLLWANRLTGAQGRRVRQDAKDWMAALTAELVRPAGDATPICQTWRSGAASGALDATGRFGGEHAWCPLPSRMAGPWAGRAARTRPPGVGPHRFGFVLLRSPGGVQCVLDAGDGREAGAIGGRISTRRPARSASGVTACRSRTARSRRPRRRPRVACAHCHWAHSRWRLNKRQRKAQTRAHLLAGPKWEESGYIFTDAAGAPLHPNAITWQFRVARNLANLDAAEPATPEALALSTLSVHGLRHTFATIALQAGVPVTVVSKYLGHSSVTMTLDVYSHCLQGAQQELANTVADVIRKGAF